jgi:hypothetical protein
MGIRIEEWPDDKIKAMHRHFLEVCTRSLIFSFLSFALRGSKAVPPHAPQIKRRNEHDKTVQSTWLQLYARWMCPFGLRAG